MVMAYLNTALGCVLRVEDEVAYMLRLCQELEVRTGRTLELVSGDWMSPAARYGSPAVVRYVFPGASG